MKTRAITIWFICIMVIALSAGLFFSRADAQTKRINVLITSSHTQSSYAFALDRLDILAASLNQIIGQDAVLAADDFSLTMLSANLYNLAIRAQEPLSETQVMDFAGRLLQEYDRRVLQTFGLDVAETADRHSQIINRILYERNRGDLTAWFEPLPDLDRQTRAMSLASWLLAGLAAFGVVLLSGTLCRSSL